MSNSTPFGGLYVATLTPFDASGRVDPAVIGRHVQFLVEGGVDGLSPCGTTGEFLYLTIGEKVRVIEGTIAGASGRVPVMAGIWGLTAREISLLARAAESAGASAVFLQPPIYYPASDDAIVAHYSVARDACGLPVFAYNIPAYAANAISCDCLERLVTQGIVAGIKDSTGKADRMRDLVTRFGDRIIVMAASDSFATEGRTIGAQGFISALANIWPAAFARLWRGDVSLQPHVDSARAAVKQGGGIPALKYLAGRAGVPFGASRLPGLPMGPEHRRMLDELEPIV